jgi:DNA polymerase-3 subunit alpha
MAGALDSLPGSRAVLMATVDRAIEVAAKHQEDKSMGQTSLFDLGGAGGMGMENTAEVLEEAEEWSCMEMLNKERNVLGMCLSGHPLDEFRPELKGFTTVSLNYDDLRKKVGSRVAVGGVVTQMRSIETKRGDTIGVGMMCDFHGDVELFFKKDDWERFRDKISEDDRILVKGELEFKRDKERKPTEELQITVEEAIQLDTVRKDMVNFVHVNMDAAVLSEEFLQKLEEGLSGFEVFEETEHGCRLVFHMETESGFEHIIKLNKYKVYYNEELLNWLRQDMGLSQIWASPKERR